ncbi:MAG: ABC transporter permease [Clostridia bacterium]|nr:ABC transporter permease [Clostridia bacterium]
MKKLLHFELFKLRKQKSLYICSAVVLGLLLLLVLAQYILIQSFGGGETSLSAVDIIITAVSASDFSLIVSIFIVLYVCGDYSQKTIKNIYSRGFSRTKVYFAKFIICMAYVVIMYIITELFALILGSAFFGFKAQGDNIFWLLLGQLFVCLAYASFAFGICNMVKRTGIAFTIVLLAPVALTVLLSVLDAIIIVSLENFDENAFKCVNLWFDGMLTILSDTTSKVRDIVLSSILPVVYGALFIGGGYLVNRNTEV